MSYLVSEQQARLWLAAKKEHWFTAASLRKASGLPRSTVFLCLRRWEEAGLLWKNTTWPPMYAIYTKEKAKPEFKALEEAVKTFGLETA